MMSVMTIGIGAFAMTAQRQSIRKPSWKLSLPTDRFSQVFSSHDYLYLSDHRSILCIRTADGKKEWETPIEPARGLFEGSFFSIKSHGQWVFTWTKLKDSQLDILAQGTGMSWARATYSDCSVEDVQVFDKFAIASIRKNDGSGSKLIAVEFSTPQKATILDTVPMRFLSQLQSDVYLFGRDMYALRNKGSKSAFMERMEIDGFQHPVESRVRQAWLLPTFWHGILVSSVYNDPRAPERERPETCLSLWSENLDHRRWTYSQFVGDPRSPDIGSSVNIVRWKDKIYADGAQGVYLLGKDGLRGVVTPPDISRVFTIGDTLFGLGEPMDLAKDRSTALFKSLDGVHFKRIGSIPDLPLSLNIGVDLWTSSGGIVRTIQWVQDGTPHRVLEYYSLRNVN